MMVVWKVALIKEVTIKQWGINGMKLFKRLLKITGVILSIIFIGLLVAYFMYNQPLPDSNNPEGADKLAEQMLTTINNDIYIKTRFLEWSFAGGKHTYKWDKENGRVLVSWDDYAVNLNLNNPSKSTATNKGITLLSNHLDDSIKKAQDYFNNDSFWLLAPFKVFDKGTNRSIVLLDDGSEGLMVTYSSGGTTPGDSYLWKLNSNGFPESFQMWVKIIPIGGLRATWDDWKVMENGLFLPASHKIGSMTLDMGNVKAYN
ncbi:hypothetical protein [Aurantibacter sp.]|uniref:hypothetical protein n=1 Tax=Aurantibacter sp. TaxID=2807103 RepID=UPI003263F8C7